METPKNRRRRRFLKTAACATSGVMFSCGGPAGPWRVLSAAEAETAAAVCAQLIPDDDEFPGAVRAGAVDYIDRQLSGHLRKHREAYRAGLAALDRTARARFGSRFSGLAPEHQIELLKAAEKARDPFFSMILAHTMQSYYGDPRHGGNRDEVGYRLLGIPVTPVRGRSRHDLTASEGS